jgi:hypothetical protein
MQFDECNPVINLYTSLKILERSKIIRQNIWIGSLKNNETCKYRPIIQSGLSDKVSCALNSENVRFQSLPETPTILSELFSDFPQLFN